MSIFSTPLTGTDLRFLKQVASNQSKFACASRGGGGLPYISEKFVPGGTNLKVDQIDCDRSLYSRFYGKLLVKTLIS